MEARCVADIAGPWIEPDWDSSLVERCRTYWSTPISELPDIALVTFINERIALEPVVVEARQRIDASHCDGSEMFDGQLAEALERLVAR